MQFFKITNLFDKLRLYGYASFLIQCKSLLSNRFCKDQWYQVS